MNAKILGIALLLVVLCVFLAIMAPGAFLTPNNIENLLRRTAMYGILGIGVAFVIMTSGIDLSIGSMVCLSGCLLALFLQVKYAPPDEHTVLAVSESHRQIILPGDVQTFQAGDRIRYYGGRRAHTALLHITSVTSTQHKVDGRIVSATVVQVAEPLSSDDTYGQVAKVYEIVSFVSERSADAQDQTPALVTIRGAHPNIGARDQIAFVHPNAGLKTRTITAAQSGNAGAELQLKGDVEGLDTEWLAVPMQRWQRMSVPAALASVLGIALGLGLLHGVLVTKMRLQPFVVTLCGLLVYRGMARWIVNDQPQGFGEEYNTSLNLLASGKLMLLYGEDGSAEFGIPYPFFILLGTAVLAAVLLNKTIWGRYMQALGRNEAAARYSGINTNAITILAYVICTVLAALGGMLFALDANSVSPSSFGNFFELYAIAAAVLGGCSLRGGEGGILGVVIGTAVMQTLKNLILLLKVSDTLEFAIIGAVILAGVFTDELLKRLALRRTAPGRG